ncbi:MAG: hypothetical protein JW884_10510 [Deltaproteobacteria bacterium]|nr:hypothetical protein [Deltaproteobacteria bacterium]
MSNEMRLSDYRSSGREPYIFRASGPEGLVGVHAGLIASALQPKESIHYLLYAPVRKAEKAPFDIQADPGSHAVAVTGRRFLISRDLHEESAAPSIQSIPFNRVLYIEIGSALLLGWLVITFENERALSRSSLFYTSTGSHHFEAAVREYRRLTEKAHAISQGENIGWYAAWRLTPRSQLDLLKSLTTDDERPLDILRFREKWKEGEKRNKKICLTTDGILLAMDRGGCLYITEERPISPGILAYGINACCFPISAIRSAMVVKRTNKNSVSDYVRIELERMPVVFPFDIPLAREEFESAERWLGHLKQLLNGEG